MDECGCGSETGRLLVDHRSCSVEIEAEVEVELVAGAREHIASKRKVHHSIHTQQEKSSYGFKMRFHFSARHLPIRQPANVQRPPPSPPSNSTIAYVHKMQLITSASSFTNILILTFIRPGEAMRMLGVLISFEKQIH